MYKIKYSNRPNKRYQCNGEIFEAQSLIQAISENIRLILKYIFGKEVKECFEREWDNEIKYEICIRTRKFEHKVMVKIIQDEKMIKEGETKIFSLDQAEDINEDIVIEVEEFLGAKEMADFISMDRRKFSTYLERGKIITPDYKLFNGPLWVKSRIENKKILELERGKKNEEF